MTNNKNDFLENKNNPQLSKNKNTNFLENKIWGALLGSAIGNAMGSIVENWHYQKIQKTYGTIDMPLDLQRIQSEDDNRIMLLFIDAYLSFKRNITPEDLASIWLKKFDPGNNFFWCMRNAFELLKRGVHPRQTGLYNINTGSAIMAIAPVGIYNMFEPQRAFADALDLAYMYQPEPDAIAAATFAAGASVAFKKNSSADMIAQTILDFAPDKDITYWDDRKLNNPKKAIQTAIQIADKYKDNKDWRSARQEIYDKLIQWHPIDPIEVLSITTCLFKITQGNYKEGVIAGTNIGRDADTIANLIGLLAGAMHGIDAIPLDWREGVLEINPSLYNSFKNKSFQFAQLLRSKFHNYRHIIDEFENIDR